MPDISRITATVKSMIDAGANGLQVGDYLTAMLPNDEDQDDTTAPVGHSDLDYLLRHEEPACLTR